MAQYIDKAALVAEIDKQIELLKPFLGACAGQIVAEANDKLSVLEELKNFLDTLEVKEVNLEKELSTYLEVVKATDEDIDFVDFAKHFFELGLKASNPLTWEDIKTIQNISGEVYAEVAKGKDDFYSIYPTEQSFLEEVLKRFKAQKGE